MARRTEICPLHIFLHHHLEGWWGGGVARGRVEEGWQSMEFATLGIHVSLGLTLLIKTSQVKAKNERELWQVQVPCRWKMLGSCASCLAKNTEPPSCRRAQAHIPYPSAAAAASESSSGFLSHCCPGLQILRFLPKKQSTHRGESWRSPIRREGKRSLGSRIQSLPVFQDAMQMKKPPAGPWAVLWLGLGALLQISLCMQWPGIIRLSPSPAL